MPFLEYLTKQGVIKENQVGDVMRQAKEKHQGSIDDALVEFGVSEENVLKLKSEYFNIPSRTIDVKTFPFEVLKYIPEDSAKHYQLVPLALKEGVLEVGIIDPENIKARDAIQFIASKLNIPFKIFLISKADFRVVVDNYKGLRGEVEEALTELDTELAAGKHKGVLIESRKVQEELKPGEEEKIVEEAPIIKIVAVIINNAAEGNASDIHIENTGEKVKVRFRVDGILHTSLVLPLNVYAGVVARIKILAKLRLDEKRKPQDGGFTAKVAGRKIDFRVSTFPAYYGEKVVMRILDSERGIRSLDDLGLSPRNLALVRKVLKKPFGLILVTGPTGSGKTTTLYSMINELDKEGSNIVSLEDPVEYHISGISQSQVMPEIGYTFATGLRSILRQDPDVIMVGEIRDKETAGLAIQAALTGHLVFSTLHTNNVLGVVPRLVDMGIDPYLISPTLALAVAQRLTQATCPSSRKVIPVDESTREMIEKQFADLPEEFKNEVVIPSEMYETVPSPECPSGTRGRMAVFEMFEGDEEMQSIILKNPIAADIYRAARNKGMLTMREDAIMKGLRGEIPFREVYKL